MKSAGQVVILCAVILVPGVAQSGQAPSIIETKVERHQGPPFWISAEAIADAEKIINLDLLDDLTLRKAVDEQRLSLGGHAAIEKSWNGQKPQITMISYSACKMEVITTAHRGGDGPTATFSDLAAYSRIVRGTIRTVEPGFAFGEPSSLLGVEVSEIVKGSTPVSPFYIDYPIARFQIGPFSFCNGRRGFEPSPGDDILLFDYRGPIDRDEILYAPKLEQIFFQSAKGSLFVPPSLKNTPGLEAVRTLDDVTGRLRSGMLRDHKEGDSMTSKGK